jgi:peptidoglycan/xylan/chitin deacetylase (PgdA/CDA1 family)
MNSRDAHARRLAELRNSRPQVRRARLAAVGSLITVAGIAAAVVLFSTSGPRSNPRRASATQSSRSVNEGATVPRGTGKPGTATIPILTYHVINVRPPASSAPPSLYVPADEFAAQMDALKAAGWHAVTLDHVQAYWTHGVSLGSGKPIVITFDGGYASQYTNALAVLNRLGWVGVENIQVSGLPASDGGLTDRQIRGLVAAGWELDAEGNSQGDPTVLDSVQLGYEIATERQTLRSRYRTAVNWYCYPSGRYNATLTAAVHAARFVGATTGIPGWASPEGDRFRLPRVQVIGGTSPSELLSQIASAKRNTSTPAASAGT